MCKNNDNMRELGKGSPENYIGHGKNYIGRRKNYV